MMDQETACNYAAELGIPPERLLQYIERYGDANLETFRQLTPEEWCSYRVQEIVLGRDQIGLYLEWREDNKQGRIDVDYSGYELPEGLGADAVSGTSSTVDFENGTCEDGYNPGARYARDNAVFIPALEYDIGCVFEARGSSWSVISLGIRAHGCTLYLLLPTALVHDYRARVEQELGDKPWLKPDIEDTTFDNHIEELKQWAPAGTKFVNRRIDIDGDGAEACNRLNEVLTAMTDLTLPPPITCTILEASHDVLETVNGAMREFKRWWCPSQVWFTQLPREMTNYPSTLYNSVPERPPSKSGFVAETAWEDSDSDGDSDSDDSDNGPVRPVQRINGGYILSNGEVEMDDSWGFNKYRAVF